MWDLLQALYCTYQGPNLFNCAAVACDFRHRCTVRTASWYVVSLEHDVDAMLHNIWLFGLAMFCGDIAESINRFLKQQHKEHNYRVGWGGGAVKGRGWMMCQGVNGRLSTGRPVRKHNV